MNQPVSIWVEAITALLLVCSGVLSLAAAIGLLRLPDFFQRMHPPALASTLGAWCVALASIVYFSALEARLALHAWLIVILLAITMPVTTIVLARAALFRTRTSGQSAPPPLRPPTGRPPASQPADREGREAHPRTPDGRS